MGQDFASDLSVCPACRSEVPSDAHFCAFCGNQLGVGPATLPPPAQRTAAAFEAPPPHLAGQGATTQDYPTPQANMSSGPRPSLNLRRSRGPLLSQRARAAATEPVPSIADPLIGATVADRYRIESLIGRGGMGVVYKVEHSKIGKVMALKLLTGELARNPDTVRRFKREALLVSKLSHPNTVQVFDYGSVGGLTYLAMEYLHGQDLGELIENQGPRPFSQVAKMIIQVCGALKEAHDKGMVHRDLKPENLFLTRMPDGEELVKILDFGLAKLRESRELNEITSNGNIVGTPYYMPPEQVRGEAVDGRSDIYALCAVLYTCITGYHVFEAPSPVAVLTQQLTRLPVAPHLRAPDCDIPESVSDIILRGLEKDPALRFQNVTELEEALRAELRGVSYTRLSLPESGAFAVEIEEESATRDEVERYERALRRRERLAGSFGLVALGVAAVLAARFYLASTKPAPFAGKEHEPNHSIKTATYVPFGKKVSGQLGRRIAPGRGDQDNFAISVPYQGGSHTYLSVDLSGLPNMATCVWVFRQGSEQPMHRYCSGAPGRGVHLKDLALRPGQYYFVVQQDTEQYEADTNNYILENVSDSYELLVQARVPPNNLDDKWFEVESNDMEDLVRSPDAIQFALHPASAGTPASPQEGIRGSLSTMRDVDYVCASGTGTARLVVADAEGGVRPNKATLLVTPVGGPLNKIPVRVHGGRPTMQVSERDQLSPFRGPVVNLAERPCVRLELTPNPFAPTPHPLIAPASDHQWRVYLEYDSPEN